MYLFNLTRAHFLFLLLFSLFASSILHLSLFFLQEQKLDEKEIKGQT
jgi:hypothetical protein